MSVYELILNNTAFGIAESVVRWPSSLGEIQIWELPSLASLARGRKRDFIEITAYPFPTNGASALYVSVKLTSQCTKKKLVREY